MKKMKQIGKQQRRIQRKFMENQVYAKRISLIICELTIVIEYCRQLCSTS